MPSELNLEMTSVDVLRPRVFNGSYLLYVCIYVIYARHISSFVFFLHALLRDEKQKRSLERLTASPPPPK